ncbi:MAG: GAF domain-containing protein [Acidobacteriota bacterium]
MECSECIRVFEQIGNALNSPIDTVELLELVSRSVVEQFHLKGCHFRLLSRDQKILEHVASYGLSHEYLDKGPVEADRSVSEALDGETVMVADCSSDPRIQYPQACTKEGIASMLTIPLKTRGQVIGVVRLSTGQPREFSKQERQIFEVVASFCASVVVHWMFHSIVANVTDAIRSSLDLHAVLDSITRVITEDLRARGCFIEILEGKGARPRLHTAYGLSRRFLDRAAREPGEALNDAVAGSCVLVLDARSDPRVPYRDEAAAEGVGSILYVPLAVHDNAIGVLCVCTHHIYEFSEDEVFLMKGVGDQCAFAIRNAQMYAAVKDQYQDLVNDFQKWFEQYQTFPGRQAPQS